MPAPLAVDKEAEAFKRDPESVASPLALRTVEAITMRIIDNGGIFNGRLAAIEIDKAIREAKEGA